MADGKIRVGIGGWTYEPWRRVFYPAGMPHQDELSYASKHLNTIEVDGTFYRLQTADTFKKWYSETPDDFVLSLKAPRFVMNRKVLAGAGESMDKFLSSGIRSLEEKLGPINWQFLPTKHFDATDFEQFLRLLPSDLKHALEVRHESFQCEAFVSLARQYGVAIVVSGDSEYPLIADPTAPFVYARIKGTVEGEAQGYSDAKLDLWANRAKAFASGEVPSDLPAVSSARLEKIARDVYLYVISGFKQSNPAAAMSLTKRL